MNLMNIQTLDWDDELLKVTAPGLRTKLPPICGNSHIAGKLHPYFSKYGLREIPVITFTGDNPSSLIGIGGWKPGTYIVALGTSDNFFAASEKPLTDPSEAVKLMRIIDAIYASARTGRPVKL